MGVPRLVKTIEPLRDRFRTEYYYFSGSKQMGYALASSYRIALVVCMLWNEMASSQSGLERPSPKSRMVKFSLYSVCDS